LKTTFFEFTEKGKFPKNIFSIFSFNRMNFTFSLEQITKTRKLGLKVILRQNKLDLVSRYIVYKSENPKLTQKPMGQHSG